MSSELIRVVRSAERASKEGFPHAIDGTAIVKKVSGLSEGINMDTFSILALSTGRELVVNPWLESLVRR